MTLVYWRQMRRKEEEFPSVEAALAMVTAQEEAGEIWAENLLKDGKPLYRERHGIDPFPPDEQPLESGRRAP